MSQNDPADRKTSQAFGFHQLRQACEISSLRQEITRILAGTADLQILIENEVERVRQCLGALDAAESQDPARLSPLLSDAMASLIEIRDASRRLEVTIARRSPDTRPPAAPAADLIEQTLRRSFTEPQSPPPQAPRTPPPEPAYTPPAAPPPHHHHQQHPQPALEPRPAPPPYHAALQPPAPTRKQTPTTKAMNWLAPSTKR